MSVVFISYSHADHIAADAIVTELEELGIETFRDVKNIEWGQPISVKVRDGLQSAAAIIVIVSPGSLKSQWVAYEVGFGVGTKKRVLPYLTHPALDVPGFMSDLSYVKSIEEVREFFTTKTSWRDLEQSKPIESSKRTATLNDMQVEYLKEISRPRNEGSIYGGIDRQTGRNFLPYKEALELYQSLDLMQYSGGAYNLTSKGWSLVDQLWGLAIVDTIEVDQHKNVSEVAKEVGLTDGESEAAELHRLIDVMEQRGHVNSMRTSSGVQVALTQQGATHRKHRPIEI